MNKTKQEEKAKAYISLLKRRDELLTKIRKAEVTLLSSPYQNGWKLSLRLRDDVYRSENGPLMLDALKLCIKEVKKYSPELISKLRVKKSWTDLHRILTHTYKAFDGKIYTVYDGPELKSISVKKFNALDERLKKFFEYTCTERVSNWGGQIHKDEKYVLIIPKYSIEVKIKKNMVTQKLNIDPEVISEYDKVEAILRTDFIELYRKGSRKSSWLTFKERYDNKRNRRHSHDAISKLEKGEIEDVQQYSKLSKSKRSV